MNNKIIYVTLLALTLIPGNIFASDIAKSDTNGTESNATESNGINATEIIPDPIVEGEKEPIESNDLEWIPVVVDTFDENGLRDGKTMYHNQKTGETREPLPYSASGLPLCHDPLYGAGVLGNRCYDELDHDDCENGYIDSGNGCEPIDCKANPDHAGCSEEPKYPNICPPSCPNDEDLPTPPPIDDGNEGVIPEDPEDTDNGNGDPEEGGNNGSLFN
jgi:hypothetical protein